MCLLLRNTGDPRFATDGNALVIRHREFATSLEVPASTLEREWAVPLQPQNIIFEWLREITRLYTFVRWRKLKFTFKALTNSVSPTSVNGAGNNLTKGTMSAVIDYDPTNALSYTQNNSLFPTKNQMLDSSGSKEVALGRTFQMYVSCSPSATNNHDLMHTIDGDPNQFVDQVRKNYGMLAVRYDGPSLSSDTAVKIYDVWVDYEVELYKPRSSALLDPPQALVAHCRHYDSTGTNEPTVLNIFGKATASRTSFIPSDIAASNAGQGFLTRPGPDGECFIGLASAIGGGDMNRIYFQGKPNHVYEIMYSLTGTTVSASTTLDFYGASEGLPPIETFASGAGTGQADRFIRSTAGLLFVGTVLCVPGKTRNQINVSGNSVTAVAGDYWVDLDCNNLSTPTGCVVDVTIKDLGHKSVYRADLVEL
jgi:hypothetical protein